MLKLQDVAVDFGGMLQFYKEDPHQLWFDRCQWYCSLGPTYSPPMSLPPVRNIGTGACYVTDSDASDMLYGFVNMTAVIGSNCDGITGDVFQNSRSVIACRAANVDGSAIEHHTDILQYFGHFEQVLVYNLRVRNSRDVQCFFLDHHQSSFQDCAFVDISIDTEQAGPAPMSQLNSYCSNVLFGSVSVVGQAFVFRDDFVGEKQFVADGVRFKSCVLKSAHSAIWGAPVPAGVEFSSCHFFDELYQGSNCSSGAIGLELDDSWNTVYSGAGSSLVLGTGFEWPSIPRCATLNKGAWISCEP
jgi:hypothetical protein